MGAIDKYIKNQADRAIDKVQNSGDKFSVIISQVQGYVGTAFEVAKNGETFVGLQYSAETPIRDAIRAYTKAVQDELSKLNAEVSNSNALKGDVAAEAQKFVAAVDKVAQAYVSSLLAYSDKMHEYVMQYQEQDAKVTSNVAEEASALESSAEVYTEKY